MDRRRPSRPTAPPSRTAPRPRDTSQPRDTPQPPAAPPPGASPQPRAIPRLRQTQDLGRLGEEAAVSALRADGYRIVERNVRLRLGELDVVAEEEGTIVFVEVKARRSVAYGTPAEAVTLRKQRVLRRLAAAYLARRHLGGRDCRFDVVEVWLDLGGGPVRVEILRDAF